MNVARIRAIELIFNVTSSRVSHDFQKVEDLLEAGFKQLEDLFEQQKKITGVPTGFKDLDGILAGMHKGDLIILAARPSAIAKRIPLEVTTIDGMR